MLLAHTSINTIAAAYGAGTYGCGRFEEGGQCQTTEPGTDPNAPLTGFFSQPAYVILPTLLALAVIIGSISYLIARKLRKHK